MLYMSNMGRVFTGKYGLIITSAKYDNRANIEQFLLLKLCCVGKYQTKIIGFIRYHKNGL